MSGDRLIRVAAEIDAAAIRAIYAPHINDSAVSFETELPSIDVMAQRIRKLLPTHPWLVGVVGGQVAGYAYAGPHRERAAYRLSVEVTAYVDAEFRGRGIGRELYAALCTFLQMQHYVNAFGIITLPNAASVALHEACGFRQCATFLHAGYKFDAWHDVGWWQKTLQTASSTPAEPIPFADLPADLLARALGR